MTRRVLLYMLEVVEGELCLLEMLGWPEVMRCVLLCMLEVVEGVFCSLEDVGGAGDAGGAGRDALCVTLYAGGAGRDALCVTLLAGGGRGDAPYATPYAGGVVRCWGC